MIIHYQLEHYLADANTLDSFAQCQVIAIIIIIERARLFGEGDGYGELIRNTNTKLYSESNQVTTQQHWTFYTSATRCWSIKHIKPIAQLVIYSPYTAWRMTLVPTSQAATLITDLGSLVYPTVLHHHQHQHSDSTYSQTFAVYMKFHVCIMF